MMRKNEPPADPALCHICLSLKNRLFDGAGAGGHPVHTKRQEMREMTDLSLRAPAEGQGAVQLPPQCPPHRPLSASCRPRHAMPITGGLMALWSQAANLSLSRKMELLRCSSLFGVCSTLGHQPARVF